ncbi:MAG: AMP-binding protein [Pseudomonadales bacterium]|nr:AMP-binding protein [Pseudomonadales bacterium]
MHDFSIVPNLVQMTLSRAQRNSSETYLDFIGENGEVETSLTYADLDRYARIIADGLTKKGLCRKNVVLLYAPGVDYVKAFFACLYAGAVPVPAYPPMGARDISRLVNVVKDCDAAAVLSSSNLMPMIEAWINNPINNVELDCISTNLFDDLDAGEKFTPFDAKPEDIAFLQYTSGSTGHPKGVMISHKNLLSNFSQIINSFAVKSRTSDFSGVDGSDYTTVIWLPPFHDMGLIGGLLTPVYAGAKVGLMSPLTFLKNPFIWLDTISKMKATVSGGPNFSYQYCARKISQDQISKLDLSSWKVAFNGAEPINTDSLKCFSNAFTACGFDESAFLPCYGLAEATLFVSGSPRGRGVKLLGTDLDKLSKGHVFSDSTSDDSNEKSAIEQSSSGKRTEMVSSGVVANGANVRIIDPITNERKENGCVGEIWINSPSVAEGYWGKPTFSDKVFRAKVKGEESVFAPGYLRTGDLGFIANGELYVTGRIKELIIVSGKNHYPQDLELTFQSVNDDFRKGCGAAFSITENGTEEVVLLQEIAKSAMSTDSDVLNEMINKGVRAMASRHGIRPAKVILIAQGKLPKTSSGKIQRCEAKKLYHAGNLVPVITWQSSTVCVSAVEKTTAEESPVVIQDWQHKLETEMKKWVGEKLNVESHLVELRVPFSDLGVDSIEAIDLVDRLQDMLHRTIPATEMMRYPTVQALLDSLAAEISERSVPEDGESSESLDALSTL